MKKTICLLLAALMAAALCPAAFAVGVTGSGAVSEPPVNPDAVFQRDEDEKEYDPNEIVTLIVKLKGAPIAAVSSDLRSPSSADAAKKLSLEQERVKAETAALFPEGVEPEFTFSYSMLFNGFAVKAPLYMKDAIEALDGVGSVFVSPVYGIPEKVESNGRIASSIGLIGADEARLSGYTGRGASIAIIDSGCVLGHEAFAQSPDSPKMDTAYLAGTLNGCQLHAEELYSGSLSASSLYYSSKIPFRFNYADGSLNVAHSYSGTDHGTRMAGVAAGFDPDSGFEGIAPDAQIAVMQVYGRNGVSDWATVMAALEDCAYLEVDAVDLSFGRDIGYSYGGEEIEAVFGLLAAHGVNIAVAAGDSASSNGQQYYGSSFNYALAMNPDNGIVASPGTYSGALCVAGCESDVKMASFSNAGAAPDLKIKPEITAPGVNVDSPADPNNNGDSSCYGTLSSTAMSSAQVTGAQAILKQYLGSAFPSLTAGERAEMANRLLMSTANPIAGVSPRLQGAGVMDISKAVSTGAYLTVPGSVRPKLELGDDPERTGIYTIEFSIVNFGADELTFVPHTTVLTPALAERNLNGTRVKYMNGTSADITSRCTVEAPASVTVPAGSASQITITVKLSPDSMTELDSNCPNGMFIEGFVTLDGDTDLSLPFLGFYGSWNRASVFDRYTFMDEIAGLPALNVHTKRTVVGAFINGADYALFGANPYITSNDWLADRCAVSPNGDGYLDEISRVTAALVRSTKAGRLTITDEADPDTVYYQEEFEYIPKSWRYRTGNYSYSWSYASDAFGFTSWAPNGLDEGARVVFELSFELDNPGFTHEQNECSRIVLPLTVDTTPPTAESWDLHDGTLDITVYDGHYAAWIGVYADPACTTLITQQAIAETVRGAHTALSIPVGNRSRVYVRLGDYGRNTSGVYPVYGPGPVALESASITPAEIVMIPGQTDQMSVSLSPADASYFSVEWSVSDPDVAVIAPDGLNASVTANSRGECTVTAVIRDVFGGEFTVEGTVIVHNGYTFDHYAPTDEIVAEAEYLIGYRSGDDVYLIMNYNPDPIDGGTLCYTFGNTEYCYGVKAAVDADGNVTGLDDERYPDAELQNAQWNFIPISGFYQIRSMTNRSYYLKVASGSTGTGLYPGYGTGNSTKWSWAPGASSLSYTTLSGVKVVSFVESLGGYEAFFNAPTGGGENSSITLFRHEAGTVIFEDPVTYTVTFIDWDGSVIDVQLVEEGGAAAAPEAPVRPGWIFTGWDCDFSCVTSDLTVTALYERVPLLIGDSNCDGKVTMADVTSLIAHIMNAAPLSEQGALNADANGDGTVSILDAAAIYTIALSS